MWCLILQLLLQFGAHHLRVGLALGFFHDLPEQEVGHGVVGDKQIAHQIDRHRNRAISRSFVDYLERRRPSAGGPDPDNPSSY